jgi:hypothetical protein
MSESENATINKAFMQLNRRSERIDRSRLVDTFVDVGPLFTLLSSHDHQIIFGRRGTGKTHALNYLSDTKTREGNVVVYVDLSNIGSSNGIYANTEIPITERATRLLVDTLLAVHEGLLEFFVTYSEELDLSRTGPLLDSFADAITEVRVVGTTQAQTSSAEVSGRNDVAGVSAELSPSGAGVNMNASTQVNEREENGRSVTRTGSERHSVHFGAVRGIWERMTSAISPRRVWLLLDEWSSVPIELQPFLADLIRRSVFPIHSVTTKIAAIEQRSQFMFAAPQGNYLGIEVGADAAADINLDDFMVFDNDAARARAFYRSLFYKHVSATDAVEEAGLHLDSELMFVRLAFTQGNTFDELVRASEGVPRDAINILIQAAQYAVSEPITMPHVRRAADAWYQRDKETTVRSRERAGELLHWIVQEVIGQRRARAFLLRSDTRDPLIESLFDARVLHILKRNISTPDEIGERYHVYKLDYGCYVNLMSTGGAPGGLMQLDERNEDGRARFVEVPPDDYRAIRRAILRVEQFYGQYGEPSPGRLFNY